MNTVISGHYTDKKIYGDRHNGLNIGNIVFLNKKNVKTYELIDETKTKSASSAILRGAAGAALLGPVGLLAGLSAKSKGSHIVAIEFNDGKKSLIELNDEYYKILISTLF